MRTFEPWDQIGTVHSTMSCEVTGCGSRAEFKREYVDWPDPGKLQVFPENTIGRLGCDFVCGPHKVKIMAIESGELTAPGIMLRDDDSLPRVEFCITEEGGEDQIYTARVGDPRWAVAINPEGHTIYLKVSGVTW